jgi:hypothetical protein
VVRFARERAHADGHDDLLLWANRLEAQIAGMLQPVSMPLVDRAAQALRRAGESMGEGPPSAVTDRPAGILRYVRGIR